MRDMHVHTEFSCDSEAKIVDYISEAKNKGITTICFTDHVDLDIIIILQMDFGRKLVR